MARKPSIPKTSLPGYDGSTPLSDAQREKYAQLLFEGKMIDVDAYHAAGFKKHKGNASRTKARRDVGLRVRWLQSQAAERRITTVQDIADQLDEDRKFARLHKAPAPAVQATMGKAKVLGLVVDKHLVGMKNVDEMTEHELRALLGILEVSGGDGA